MPDTRSPFPEGSLVLLVGPPAAGKTTFAARLVAAGVVAPDAVLSSDELRRQVTGSEADTSRDRNVFSALRARLRERLTAGETTVIDATNLGRPRRRRYAAMAADAGRPVIAVRFEVPIPVLLSRNAGRNREVPPGAVVGMARDMAKAGRPEELVLDGCDIVLEAGDIPWSDSVARSGGGGMRALGRTGVQVSPFCLGAMMFGAWGNPDHEESIRIIHRALDAGINFIDTADVYSAGESEEIVAKALRRGRRDEVVLATKVHFPMGDGPNRQGNSRRWITLEVENSLRRLGTDWIDLYQIHRPDLTTDIDETLGALTDLVRAGKIRYFGSSTFPAHAIVEAQWVAERRNRERFVTEQPPYSILVRGIEADVLPVCQQYGLGVLTWSPLAGGWLSGRYRKNQDVPTSHRAERIPQRYDMSLPGNQRKLEAADQLGQLADKVGLPLVHLAVAFALRHPGVTSVIIGPRTMEQLESQLPATELVLGDDVLDQIDDIVPPGQNLHAADAGWQHPALANPGLRRRSER